MSLVAHNDPSKFSKLLRNVSKTMTDKEKSSRQKAIGVLSYIIPESRLDFLGLYQVCRI